MNLSARIGLLKLVLVYGCIGEHNLNLLKVEVGMHVICICRMSKMRFGVVMLIPIIVKRMVILQTKVLRMLSMHGKLIN